MTQLNADSDHPLWQIVYASAAIPGFELSDLEQILRVAREHNASIDVTGMLLFEGKSFLQVLEGEIDDLDQLFRSIGEDRRHTRVVTLLREPIEERSFADWTMGYTRVALGELKDATGINDFFQDPDAFLNLNDAKVRKVLALFRTGSFRQRLT